MEWERLQKAVCPPRERLLSEVHGKRSQLQMVAIRNAKLSGRAVGMPDCSRSSSSLNPGWNESCNRAGKRAGPSPHACSREGSSCGAKGKVQVWGQVEILPAPQLLLEMASQRTLLSAG